MSMTEDNVTMCPNCGAECSQKANYCMNCGEALRDDVYDYDDSYDFEGDTENWCDTSEVRERRFSINFFSDYLLENICIIAALVIINVILMITVTGYIRALLKWYYIVPSIALGVIGFFCDVGNIWLQRMLKCAAFPAVLLVLAIGLGIIVVIAAGSGGLHSDSQSASYQRQLRVDSAASKMKTAAHNKAVADAMAQSYDKHTRANAKIQSAHYQGEINEALADILSNK